MGKNLQSLKNELKQLTELLALDLSNWDIRTKPGMQGRQNAAKIRVEELRKDLGYFILRDSVTLLLMRDYKNTASVVESAKKNPKANIVLDALMIEKKIFKTIFGEKTTTFTYNSDIVNRMNILMSEIGLKIEAESLPVILGNAKYFGTVRTRQEMIERMETVIMETYADELKLHFFRALIIDEISDRLDRDAVNIVFVNVTQPMIRALSSYAGKTQILSNDTEVIQMIDNREEEAEEESEEVTVTVGNAEDLQAVQQTPVVPAELTTPVKIEKPYTGARRGRKTNAERAALAAQKTTEGQTNGSGN